MTTIKMILPVSVARLLGKVWMGAGRATQPWSQDWHCRDITLGVCKKHRDSCTLQSLSQWRVRSWLNRQKKKQTLFLGNQYILNHHRLRESDLSVQVCIYRDSGLGIQIHLLLPNHIKSWKALWWLLFVFLERLKSFFKFHWH